MKFMISTLAHGGFSIDEPSLYALLLNKYVYIGITGTSNNTGRSSPNQRLAAHAYKRGNTKSVIWGDLIPNSLAEPDSLSVRMLSIFVPQQLVPRHVERAIIFLLQERLKPGLLRNSRVPRLSKAVRPEEQEMAGRFVEGLLTERAGWIVSHYGNACLTEQSAQTDDGEA